MNTKGFTLTELLIALLVSGIIALTIGIISQISTDSYMNLRREAELYNEIYSGFDLVERSVRRADNVSVSGNTLTADNLTFQVVGNDLVYADASGNHAILADGNFTFVPTLTGGLVTVNLLGDKHDYRFNQTIEVVRRN